MIPPSQILEQRNSQREKHQTELLAKLRYGIAINDVNDPMETLERKNLRKRDEVQCLQNRFDFAEAPARHLRAVYVTHSDMAREVDFAIFRNMRVPESSVIHRVYSDGVAYLDANENLDIWESSDGNALKACLVNVKARKSWDGVEALITPVSK